MFNVVMNAPDYSSTKVITALQPGNSVQVEFDVYTVPGQVNIPLEQYHNWKMM